jgi:hypothetical protein
MERLLLIENLGLEAAGDILSRRDEKEARSWAMILGYQGPTYVLGNSGTDDVIALPGPASHLAGSGTETILNWNNISPRIGLTYELGGSSSIKSGYAMYNDQVGLCTPSPNRQSMLLTVLPYQTDPEVNDNNLFLLSDGDFTNTAMGGKQLSPGVTAFGNGRRVMGNTAGRSGRAISFFVDAATDIATNTNPGIPGAVVGVTRPVEGREAIDFGPSWRRRPNTVWQPPIVTDNPELYKALLSIEKRLSQ